ncbi:MAG: 50S ribosomal protein L1 [Patescibacteria group bacterium]
MKKRSKKYLEATKLIEEDKIYSLDEGLEIAKKTATTKFDGSLEVHINLSLDPKVKQVVRGSAVLPAGSGKKVRICVFAAPDKQKEAKEAGAEIVGGEELVKEIKKTQKTDFDVAVATPEMMKTLAQIAKILGQRGLMPNPKSETINPNPAKIVAELSKGKITFKSDEQGNLHQMIGKISFEKSKLLENLKVFLEAVKKSFPKEGKPATIKSITLASTMGPGIKVQNK